MASWASSFWDTAIKATQVVQESVQGTVLAVQETVQGTVLAVQDSVASMGYADQSGVVSPTSTDYNSAGGAGGGNNKELDLVYITENLISMAFPCDAAKMKVIPDGNDLQRVSEHFQSRHAGHFMIWNISEESYDYSRFEDQVLEYKFPGHPSPPLGLLFKICTSIENWLDADEMNVAVIHCLTGKGRTAAMISCILAWMGEFTTPMEALKYVAQMKSAAVNYLVIPSQRRYLQYFSNMLDGIKPRAEPMVLKKIIFHTIPVFGDNGGGDVNNGCCPYIQLFKCGKLMATASPLESNSSSSTSGGGSSTNSNSDIGDSSRQEEEDHDKSSGVNLKWVTVTEDVVTFNLDYVIQGDVLLRCRHIDPSGARVSMFRAAFHTGYIPSGAYRLEKAQLDGANTDFRFSEDFFVDLIFEPASKEVEANFAANNSALPTDSSNSSNSSSSSSSASIPGAGSTSTSIVDKYENSLHRDTRFWDAVSFRKSKCKRRRPRKFAPASEVQFSISDDFSSTISNLMTNVLMQGGGGSEGNSASSSLPTPPAISSASSMTTTGDDKSDEFEKNLLLTDEEMILQSHKESGAGSPKRPGVSSGLGETENAEREMEDFIRNLTNGDSSSSSSSSSSSNINRDGSGGGSGDGASPDLLSSQVNLELAALEELEKALGLGLGGSDSLRGDQKS